MPAKPGKERQPYYHITEGEWTEPTMRGFALQCCDCGLTHIMDFQKTERGIKFRTRVNRRATSAARRAFNFSKD